MTLVPLAILELMSRETVAQKETKAINSFTLVCFTALESTKKKSGGGGVWL